MTDYRLLALYAQRSEEAIAESERRYGSYLKTIARNILGDEREAEECVNDALLRAWNAIPPHAPENMATYLGKITRNLAINRYRAQRAEKRGGGLGEILSELDACIPSGPHPEEAFSANELNEAINAYLRSLSVEKRTLFLRRYWYADPIKAIAKDVGKSPAAVAMALSRMRADLKTFLCERSFDV